MTGEKLCSASLDGEGHSSRTADQYLCPPWNTGKMDAPDMRELVRELEGKTLYTVARARPNVIVRVTADQALVETEDGDQNWVSLNELQKYADRIFAGEEVVLPLRGRSAFHAAVLATLPELDHALNPRRFWLKDPPEAFDREYDELFPEEDPTSAQEGRLRYRRHRVRERSLVLRRLKIEAALREDRELACEACGFDFAAQYGVLGEGFIECHHRVPFADGEERETTLADLALLCANCHRMIHKAGAAMSVEDLAEQIRR